MAYELRNLNILLVEDNFTMRTLLRDVLTAFGVKSIVSVSDGGRAWNELRHFQADLAIVDWNMRPVSGLQFVRRVRTGKDSPNNFLPVILLNAYSERRRVMLGRDAGVTEFLVKPVTPKRLYDRIAAIIESNRGFIRSKTYFGPDRRRSDKGIPGQDRRNQSSLTVVDFERFRTESS
ncbi:MAG: response regulator [Rhodospirillaceae bacterium]|nr:response regulator [Rhodospirillaceae bacterium]